MKLQDKADTVHLLTEQLERVKASIRARLKHPCRVIERQLVHVKVRYRGLATYTAQLQSLFALVKMWMVRGLLSGSLA